MHNFNNKYDVVVCGGGVAGVSCAYTCAKLGLKTLLIEKESYLGGDVTGGLVVPVMKSNTKNLNTEFYDDLVKYSKQHSAQFTYSDGNSGWFNPIILKYVLDKMLKEVSCNIIFESEIKNAYTNKNFVEHIEISSQSLSLPIVSKYYVDATGNASLAKILNCEFWVDTDEKQPASLRFIVGNVNLDKFANFLEKIDNDINVTTTYRCDSFIHLSTAYTWDKSKKWALEPYFSDALSKNILKEQDLSYFQLFTIANMPHSVAFNCPRLRDFDTKNPIDYSNAIIEAREAILRLHKFCVKYFSGFENSYISNIAPTIGKREISRVKCQYDYTINDILEQKSFKNPALCSDYPIDIHSNTKDKSVLHKVCTYTLPIESLKSKNYNNLYVAGKILGCDFKAQAALRVQSSCMSMGEAVAKDIHKNIN